MKRELLGLIIISSLFLNGCFTVKAHQKGDLPKSEVCFIEGDAGAIINRINEKSMFPELSRDFGVSRYEILPGKHRLEVSFNIGEGNMRYFSKGNLIVNFMAEAGKDYLVGADYDKQSMSWYPWVKDTLTAEVVSVMTGSVESAK